MKSTKENIIIDNIREELFELGDESYKNFHSKLIPNIKYDSIIGIRTPVLRKYAKELFKSKDAAVFMSHLPHKYYEENNLHCFLIEQIKDYDECVKALDVFLPYVDNWATCDSMTPKVFKKNTGRLINEIDRWIISDNTYSVRFAIEMLMKFFLEDCFEEKYLEKVANVSSEEYYIKMMIAWYFATALAKQYEASLVYLEEKKLDTWTHNKTIQKAIESYRISDEQKQYLRTLRIR